MSTANQEPISYELDGEIAMIGLRRPEKRNAVSDRVVEALNLAIERAQDEAKAAVIFGEGTHFCAGLDLAEHMQKPLIGAVMGSRRWHRSRDRRSTEATGDVPHGTGDSPRNASGGSILPRTRPRVRERTPLYGTMRSTSPSWGAKEMPQFEVYNAPSGPSTSPFG